MGTALGRCLLDKDPPAAAPAAPSAAATKASFDPALAAEKLAASFTASAEAFGEAVAGAAEKVGTAAGDAADAMGSTATRLVRSEKMEARSEGRFAVRFSTLGPAPPPALAPGTSGAELLNALLGSMLPGVLNANALGLEPGLAEQRLICCNHTHAPSGDAGAAVRAQLTKTLWELIQSGKSLWSSGPFKVVVARKKIKVATAALGLITLEEQEHNDELERDALIRKLTCDVKSVEVKPKEQPSDHLFSLGFGRHDLGADGGASFGATGVNPNEAVVDAELELHLYLSDKDAEDDTHVAANAIEFQLKPLGVDIEFVHVEIDVQARLWIALSGDHAYLKVAFLTTPRLDLDLVRRPQGSNHEPRTARARMMIA